MLEKNKVVVSKRGSYKGRGEPPEWRMVQRVKEYQPRKWCEDYWARIIPWFRECLLQRKQGMQEGQTEEEEMSPAAENENHEGDDEENQSERKNGCEQQWVGR